MKPKLSLVMQHLNSSANYYYLFMLCRMIDEDWGGKNPETHTNLRRINLQISVYIPQYEPQSKLAYKHFDIWFSPTYYTNLEILSMTE